MKKLLTLTFLGLILSAASYALPITGVLGSCVGGSSALSDSSIVSGTWSSSNTSIATVDASSGDVTGVATGTATITFSSGGTIETALFTVSYAPAPITGPTTVCTGGTIALTDATPGGSWTAFGAASVASSTGVVTGSYGGSATIEYMTGPGCYVSASVTVSTSSTGYISGDSSVCVGFSTTLTDGVGGGTWSSGTPAVATISATGVVTGVSAGYTIISYTVSGSCGLASTTMYLAVNSSTSAGTIGGTLSAAIGGTSYLWESIGGGSWSSSNPSVATIDTMGMVTGIAPGTTTITYSVVGCSGPATVTATFTVYSSISGNVNFTGTAYYGSVKVWLISYNPSTLDLEAVDSTETTSSGASAYYIFNNEPTDSYRVKAATVDSVTLVSGYLPTYHTSDAYWHDATVLYHSSSASDINQDINMMAGTPTTGPGFIGGNVTTGANRGTSDGSPVVGMQIFAVSSAGAILQYTFTDAAGHYSFSNLPVGTYTIYPEAINYATTAYTHIVLTSTSSSMSAASFIQHTISHTITPVLEGVSTVKSYVSSVIAFPNPTSGKLNIQWNESTTETGTVTIADIAGREISKTTINMTEGAGSNLMNLSALTNGIYLISIKSGNINYNNKIQVQH